MNLGEICFDLSLLIYPLISWARHAVLSSYITIRIFEYEDILQIPQIWWITDRNYMYSRLISCIARISEWLEDVTTKVCFVDFQEIVIPLNIKTYLFVNELYVDKINNLHQHNEQDLDFFVNLLK